MLPPLEFRKALKEIPGIPIESIFYRFLKIQFLKNPLSGLGSFKHGGRYNYKNEFEVLYLTSNPDAAFAEGSRDEFLIPPSVLITVKVKLQNVIDFESDEIIDSLGILKAELKNPWRNIQDIDGGKAYTQVMGELIYDSGDFEAIRYPSVVMSGKYNLAIFINRLGKSSKVEVYDPEHRINKVDTKRIKEYKGLLKGMDTTIKRDGYRY